MSFDLFWAKFPRHDARKDAQKAWDRLNPSPELVEKIFTALSWQVFKDDWQKDNGRYIPYAASWLRGERWTDERTTGTAGVSKGGLLLDCPHDERCVSRWACGIKQLQEQMNDDDPLGVPDVRESSRGSR